MAANSGDVHADQLCAIRVAREDLADCHCLWPGFGTIDIEPSAASISARQTVIGQDPVFNRNLGYDLIYNFVTLTRLVEAYMRASSCQ